MAIASTPARIVPVPPTGKKAAATYERLIASAGELLGEIGFEKLTTNAICKRAKLTPPALYRYFKDKHEIVEVLALRLLQRQNDAFAVWLLENRSGVLLDKPATSIADWYRKAAEIVATEPGAMWTMRALRAMPILAHIRVESQRETTDRLMALYSHILPQMDRELMWSRIRIWVEIGWIVDELAMEEDLIPHDLLFHEVARIVEAPITRRMTDPAPADRSVAADRTTPAAAG
ncbi:TetR/AcrR family transcriptional regulator [Sphingomonas sp. RP10(2022)]|uniref:TetR/AcrR family transcriptional regulator n=1 Tax=Sphingomonas liriopis TaxID=2949094 RepID=A0A9X2HUZ8_9SPHN|nr:TetR/AcrR family transcriptional regulator [Sphingomonas liriopis]MCP3734013.1 TetR/AcrR family transcriptional regulator [Sphingomonas liriopis]